MGNGSASGGMCVKLETYNLHPGDHILGTVFLQLNEPMKSPKLYIEFKGREKTYWKTHRRVNDEDRIEHHRARHSLAKYKNVVYSWPEGLNSGDYTFSFTYILPSALPGSFYYKDHSAKATIAYKLKAKLVSSDGDKLKSKVIIMLRDPILPGQQHANVVLEKTARLKVCCSDKGSTYIKGYFQKDCYSTSEQPVAMAEVNNTQSMLNVVNIDGTLWRSVRIKDNLFSSKYMKDKIYSCQAAGVPMGQALLAENIQTLFIDLPSARNKVEDMFTCNGNLIECSYFFTISAVTDGNCMCCGDTPSVSCPMTLVADTYVPPPLPPMPPNWNPQNIELAEFNYADGAIPSAPDV